MWDAVVLREAALMPYKIYLCGLDEPVADDSDCVSNDAHTPAPRGYIAWHEWANKMGKTHRQVECSGCGLLKIWMVK